MIQVIANIQLFDGKRKDYLEELKKVIPLVKAETGCLGYAPATDIITDIPIQEPVDDNIITIIERWTDVDTLKRHLEMDHMKNYFAAVSNMVKETRVRVLQPL